MKDESDTHDTHDTVSYSSSFSGLEAECGDFEHVLAWPRELFLCHFNGI